jgi:hypothetical protein
VEILAPGVAEGGAQTHWLSEWGARAVDWLGGHIGQCFMAAIGPGSVCVEGDEEADVAQPVDGSGAQATWAVQSKQEPQSMHTASNAGSIILSRIVEL